MKDSFIKDLSRAELTGGGIYNDVIYLNNGMIIRISEELICIYKNETADSDGEEVAHAEMVEEPEICLSDFQRRYVKDFIKRWEAASDRDSALSEDVDALSAEYREWCDTNELPQWSADELLAADTSRTLFQQWNQGEISNFGSFQTAILNAYRLAGYDNQQRLEEAFPEWFK